MISDANKSITLNMKLHHLVEVMTNITGVTGQIFYVKWTLYWATNHIRSPPQAFYYTQ